MSYSKAPVLNDKQIKLIQVKGIPHGYENQIIPANQLEFGGKFSPVEQSNGFQ